MTALWLLAGVLEQEDVHSSLTLCFFRLLYTLLSHFLRFDYVVVLGVFVLGVVAILGVAVLGLTHRECLCHLNLEPKI